MLKALTVAAISFGAVATFTLPTGPADAQATMNCLKRDMMVGRLDQVFKEELTAIGVTDGGGVVELLQSEDGRSWSIIMTYPTGVSCMLAAGENWHDAAIPDIKPKT